MTPNSILLISNGAGVYIPQNFCSRLELRSMFVYDSRTCFIPYSGHFTALFDKIPDDTFTILTEGPEHGDYWDAWEDLLCRCTLRNNVNEKYYSLCQSENGDLWAIPDEESNYLEES
jgi:hypothetical protein